MATGQDVELYRSDSSATVRAPSGELLTFTRNLDGTYTSPPGLHATLAFVDPPPPPGPCDDGGCPPEEPEYFTLTDHATGGQLQFAAIYYESRQRLIAQRDRYGNTIRFTYNSADNLTSITDSQNRVVTVTQNNGRIERLTDWTGRAVQYGYDAQGRLATYTDAENKQTIYGYDGAGLLASITTPGGRWTKITYDTSGRVKTIVRTTDTAHTTGPTTRFDYGTGTPCATGQTKTVVSDPEAATSAGHTMTYCGDTSGRIAKTVNANGHTTSLTYGPTGDVASVTLPGGGVTNYAYDQTTRDLLCVQRGVTVVQNCQSAGGGLKTTLTYAGTDALTKHFPTAIKNPQDNTVTYCYNGSTPVTTACPSGDTGPPGSLRSVTNGLAAQSVQRFAYYLNGNLASLTDARGYATSYAYDGAGNLTAVTPPTQAFVPIGSTHVGPTRITPDALSRPATITDAKSQTANYTYDKLDRPKDIVYKTAGNTVDRTISHTFDNDGPMRTLTDPTGLTTYTIDDLMRLTREAFASSGGGAHSYTHDYTYDAASNLKTLTDASGTTTYTYNGLNQLSAMREPLDTQDTLFSYNSDGDRTQIKYTSGATVNWGYDIPSGRITSVANKDQAGNVLKSYTYTYTSPATGKDTELQQTVTDALNNRTVNSYDALERLTAAVTSGGPNPSYFAFTLDGNGNRTSSTINPSNNVPWITNATTTWAYDEVNLPCWRAGWTNPPTGGPYTCSSRPAATLAFVQSLNHDANGNDIDNRHQAFTYNTANQPTTVTADTSPYRPVAQQPLAHRGAGQSQLVKDGAATVQQNLLGIGARGTGTTYYPRTADGTLISERPRNADGTPNDIARRNYLYDANGSVVGLTNSNGQLTTSYRYDPYGHPQNKSPTGDENPFGYGGTYMAGLATDGVLCGGVYMGDGGLPYDPEDGRYTMYVLATARVSPNYQVNFDIGRRARQQAADVVGGGLRGRAREIFLHKARTDPKTAAAAKRTAEYHNPRPKPDRAIGLDDVAGVFTVRRVLEAIGGCVGAAGAGAYYGGAVGSPVAGAAGGCIAGGLAAVFGGNLVQPWRSGQPG